ncbi:helix-turn-helix domain-containing protein [Psychroflexus sediminis]|uniref:DNA binding domain-containing protein, excisionase family n=1 Tax=Psychroflexus sediminis TaxID=470826 RepID=A0A1G7XEH2_9FLAO|nr:helix-turn-helix domain-containing protein [Psychroflexus sediminis]SDG82648.1 DNA binding domain-containing protein, excisionase family [Psychroflexus sediminis]
MSSKLKIKKTCQFCKSEFIAKTTVTKYCSHKCAQRAYKQRKKEEKVKAANENSEAKKSNQKTSSEMKISSPGKGGEITGEITNDVVQRGEITGEITNDVMTANEAAKALGVTRKTVYNMIKNGKIRAYNIHKRLTRIDRESVEQLLYFEPEESEEYDSEDFYIISEISKKYNVSPSTVYETLKEYKVPKRSAGKFVKVPKNIVDLIFKKYI